MFEIQSNALARRMRAIGTPSLVLGVSGGLDSTAAALVAAAALDLEGRPRTDLVCVTMPGFGTSEGTRDNASLLSNALGATLHEIPIGEASRSVLDAIGHPAAEGVDDAASLVERLRQHPAMGDVTLENVQARLRTLLLMSIANRDNGIVGRHRRPVGEGARLVDLRRRPHRHVRRQRRGAQDAAAVRHPLGGPTRSPPSWSDSEQLRSTLFDILDTPISPELLPADAAGQISQLTEEKIGPYELHDFYLYHHVRHGARPARILDLASIAFEDRYEKATLVRWARVFLRRFFTQQFKRSCTADAPKVGSVSLSPRADWRMPSDASAAAWLADLDAWAVRNGVEG